MNIETFKERKEAIVARRRETDSLRKSLKIMVGQINEDYSALLSDYAKENGAFKLGQKLVIRQKKLCRFYGFKEMTAEVIVSKIVSHESSFNDSGIKILYQFNRLDRKGKDIGRRFMSGKLFEESEVNVVLKY